MDRILRVSEVNLYVKSLFEADPILADLQVLGEIANFRRHPSGHLYLSLRDGGGTLRAVMFRGRAARLGFEPVDGMQVLARGRLGVYERDGVYQLYIEDMRPAGAGEAYLAFLALKARLEGEGLFAPERKRQLPVLPRRVGVITARQGAALRDIVAVGRRRYPGLAFLVIPALVQGEGAAESIVRALSLMNSSEVDVVILGRGGGAAEDLGVFNREEVVRAVAGSRWPLVAAVGHETDFTLVDFAADRRAPTPSAAAELVVPRRADLVERVRGMKRRLAIGLERRSEVARLKEREAARRLRREIGVFLDGRRSRLADVERRQEEGIRRMLSILRQALIHRRTQLAALSPLAALERGYVLLQQPGGGVITRAAALSPRQHFRVRFADGAWRARAEERES